MNKKSSLWCSLLQLWLCCSCGCWRTMPTALLQPVAMQSVLPRARQKLPRPAPADPRLAQAQGKMPILWPGSPCLGTNIDGPVQQADDNEYYLRRDELGQPSHQGCIYADYECDLSGTELSMNTILYGHTFYPPQAGSRLGVRPAKPISRPRLCPGKQLHFLSVKDQMFTFQVISAGMAAADAEQTSIPGCSQLGAAARAYPPG